MHKTFGNLFRVIPSKMPFEREGCKNGLSDQRGSMLQILKFLSLSQEAENRLEAWDPVRRLN